MEDTVETMDATSRDDTKRRRNRSHDVPKTFLREEPPESHAPPAHTINKKDQGRSLTRSLTRESVEVAMDDSDSSCCGESISVQQSQSSRESTEKTTVFHVTADMPKTPNSSRVKFCIEQRIKSVDAAYVAEVGSEILPMKPGVGHKFPLERAYWRSVSEDQSITKDKFRPSDNSVSNKEKFREEATFIKHHFKQRICKKYCEWPVDFKKAMQAKLKIHGIKLDKEREFCACGLEKKNHNDAAIEASSDDNPCNWTVNDDTARVPSWNFGNMDIPGEYNYLDTPGGTRKYIRLDDVSTKPRDLWYLLTKVWRLKFPHMVISVTGGAGCQKDLAEDPMLAASFENGLMKCAVKTRAWIITEGLNYGSSRLIGDVFQNDLSGTEWAEEENHTSIPLIAVPPWGIVADRARLQGVNVGSDEAVYYGHNNAEDEAEVSPALDPYHVVYLLADNGTYGRYRSEPQIRSGLEKLIKFDVKTDFGAEKGVPVVILVVGGDKFTLQKVSNATSKDMQMPVVIVNGSGDIANMLAATYKALEQLKPRSSGRSYGWSDEEEVLINKHIRQYRSAMNISADDEGCLRQAMKARHLIEVFGVEQDDHDDLDKAILVASVGGISDIGVQLMLSLNMDRCDIAREMVLTENRQSELKDKQEMLQNALQQALCSHKPEFIQLLMDRDYGGELEFDKFLTIHRLYELHQQNLSEGTIMGKILRSMTTREVNGTHTLDDPEELLPQVGRILYRLLGDNYRLLYQENTFRNFNTDNAWRADSWNEAVWHLFLWAVLANRLDIAELLVFELTSKIGAALIAFKLFNQLKHVAETWAEVELVKNLEENADYFQDLAVETLGHMYELSRQEAYTTIVSELEFPWGTYITPLTIADDAEAMTFMAHSTCQTFLNLVWMHYMDLDTPRWRLFPLFALFPINLPMIVFSRKNLSFGYYSDNTSCEITEDAQEIKQAAVLDAEMSAAKKQKGSKQNDASSDGALWREDAAKQFNGRVMSSTGRRKPLKDNKKTWWEELQFMWFCVKSYYTAPLNKYLFSMISYLVLLGLFTHFVLTKLAPIDSASDCSIYEWLVMVWVVSLTLEEISEVVTFRATGPLHNLSWTSLTPEWHRSFYWHERLGFICGLYRLKLWLSEGWNKVDAMMMTMYYSTVVLRFTMKAVDFDTVRIMYAITLMVFYFRVLRMGYINKAIGPRIITIRAMMADLIQFIIILAVFMISFGVAYQALLDPERVASWDLLSDVIWRPYWQMYGDFDLSDVDNGMGRDVHVPRNCTSSRELAKDFPDTLEYCHKSWLAPILLAIYMLISNVLLLNLLIAIFSHSYELIEAESNKIWRYHLHGVIREYYYAVWLPAPLNVLCHLFNILASLVNCIRRRLNRARSRPSRRVTDLLENIDNIGKEDEGNIEDDDEEDPCAREDVNLFRQPSAMRDEDLEEKAYKRHLRTEKKRLHDATQNMLNIQDKRLQTICTDLQLLKRHSGLDMDIMAGVATPRTPHHTTESSTRPSVTSFTSRQSGLARMSSKGQFALNHSPRGSISIQPGANKQQDELAELKATVSNLNDKVSLLLSKIGPVLDRGRTPRSVPSTDL